MIHPTSPMPATRRETERELSSLIIHEMSLRGHDVVVIWKNGEFAVQWKYSTAENQIRFAPERCDYHPMSTGITFDKIEGWIC